MLVFHNRYFLWYFNILPLGFALRINNSYPQKINDVPISRKNVPRHTLGEIMRCIPRKMETTINCTYTIHHKSRLSIAHKRHFCEAA